MNVNKLHSAKLRNMASVYLRKGDKLLLLFRQGDSIVSNLWIGSAGGHFEKAELNDAKTCVLRELYEELAIDESSLQNLTLRYVTLRYTADELRQNYYFFADLNMAYKKYFNHLFIPLLIGLLLYFLSIFRTFMGF